MTWVLDTPTWALRLILRVCCALDALPVLQLYISMELAERASIVERLNDDALARAVRDLREDGYLAWAAPGCEA